jgi:penicillin-binding protein 1A
LPASGLKSLCLGMLRRLLPKRKRSSGRHNHAASGSRRSLFFRVVYLFLVVAIWATVVSLIGLAWFAYDLPDPDRFSAAATRRPTITVLAADGSEIGRRGNFYGNFVDLKDVPATLLWAVLATEDRRFYSHHGIDPRGLARATLVNLRAGRIRQGGSTITQQLAKNLFLTRDRTFKRKIQEVLLAIWLEQRFTKDEIFALYLNRVYLGSGSYGVDAAALRYFGKPARDLSLYESAVIAGLLKAPSRDNPIANAKRADQRARQVLLAMAAVGWIGADDAAKAVEAASSTLGKSKTTNRRRTAVDVGSGYFTDWVIEQIEGFVGAPDRDLVIQTTLRPRLQKIAETAIDQAIRGANSRHVEQGALVALAPDGSVIAMVGGRDYRVSQYNRAAQAERQPGSAFKLFVYLAAIEAGLRPSSKLTDEPITVEGWTPRNAGDVYSGVVTFREAAARSINAVAVGLSERVGRDQVVRTARRLGIIAALAPEPSLALGVNEVSLLELTGAYAVVANGGFGIWPHGIKVISDRDGTILYRRHGDGPGRVIADQHIQYLNDLLSAVVLWGTGKAAQLKRPAAGKTGTSQEYRDAWFVGYTPDLIAGVWFGNDNARSMDRVTGGSLAAPAWRRFMTDALVGVPRSSLPGATAAGKAAR